MTSHACLPAFATMPSAPYALERGWNESSDSNVCSPPALLYRLSLLEEKLKLAYRGTSEGLVLSILHAIPPLVVETRKKVDEVKELVELPFV